MRFVMSVALFGLIMSATSAQMVKLHYKNEFLAGIAPVQSNGFRGVKVLPNGQIPRLGHQRLRLWFIAMV